MISNNHNKNKVYFNGMHCFLAGSTTCHLSRYSFRFTLQLKLKKKNVFLGFKNVAQVNCCYESF